MESGTPVKFKIDLKRFGWCELRNESFCQVTQHHLQFLNTFI